MLFLPVSILCFVIVAFMFIHIFRTWKTENKSIFKKLNEIIYTLLALAFGIYYPFLILKLGGNNKGVILPSAVDEFTLLGNIFIVGIMMIIALWGISAKVRTIRNPELLKEQNNYEFFCSKLIEEYPERSKINRRVTHILPGAVVSLCIVIFYFFLKDFLGNVWSNYALFFIVIIGIDFAFTFLCEDLIRLFDFSYMPPTAIKMCYAGLIPDELDTFSSTSVMVFSFGPFIFLSFPIFFIVLLITSVSDAMAALFGILASDKKHHFPKGTDKSIEGYIGGFIFTFICTLFGTVFSNFFGFSNWSIELALYLALILSIVFVIIDIITTKVKLSDNYLNPLVTGLVLILLLISLNIPIF
ncbi:MAG: phosphatidate cytidylyltransferase [Promethearchaeota archaeon]